MKRVFISYRRDDTTGIAKEIGKGLSKHLGKRFVFIDVDDIRLAVDFRKAILDALEKTGVLLVLIGPNWLSCTDKNGERRLNSPDDNVRIEIDHAMIRDIPILPVLIGGTRMPAPDDLPPCLRSLAFQNALTIREDGLNFEDDLKQVRKAIRGLIEGSTKKVALGLASLTLVVLAALAVGFVMGRQITASSKRSYGDSQRHFLEKMADDHYSYKLQEGSIDFFHTKDRYTAYQPIPLTLGRRSIDTHKTLFHYLTLSGINAVSEKNGDVPVFIWDVLPSHRFELKYFKKDRGSSSSNMFVVGTPSFRHMGDDHDLLVPTVEKAVVSTGIDGGIRVESRSHFGTAADVVSIRNYFIPSDENTTANLTVEFRAEEDIDLGKKSAKCDSFRFLTVSSHYNNATDYDADVILYEDRRSQPLQIRLNDPEWKLNDPERNDVHLFREVQDPFKSLGTWFELVNEGESEHQPLEGEGWRHPDGPSLRVEVIDSGGHDLGIQAYLYRTKDPNKRTLDVWIEWLDAPLMIPAGTEVKVAFKITASPPHKVSPGTQVAPRKVAKVAN